jgi:hypothetical protein
MRRVVKGLRNWQLAIGNWQFPIGNFQLSIELRPASAE